MKMEGERKKTGRVLQQDSKRSDKTRNKVRKKFKKGDENDRKLM